MQRRRAVRHLQQATHRVVARRPHLYTSVNPVGIYHLEEEKRDKVFGPRRSKLDPRLIDLSIDHLTRNDLIGKETSRPEPVQFDLPHILGSNIDEHFQKIGKHLSDPYLSWAKSYATEDLPELPKTQDFQVESGWIRYESSGEWSKVPYPQEKCITFDTEVMYQEHEFAVIAVAGSSTAWYVWLSPWLLGETQNPRQLVPLGTDKQLVVGYNVGYDRKRVKEEYNLHAPPRFFIDAMSLHIATNGMCSRQRPTWQKLQKAIKQAGERYDNLAAEADQEVNSGQWTAGSEAAVAASDALSQELKKDPWFAQSSTNSLAEVVRFMFGEKMDKSDREVFGKAGREEVLSMAKELIEYCAKDVYWTKRVFSKLLGEFLTLCPHPVSFAALGPLSQLFLPIDHNWQQFTERTESQYQEITVDIKNKLEKIAWSYADTVDDPEAFAEVLRDPWLSQLDWQVVPIKMAKSKNGEPPRPYKNQKMPGKPNWIKSLYPSATKPINLTLRTRVAPLLLKLQWDKNPLFWTDKYGWCFWAVPKDAAKYEAQGMVLTDEFDELWTGDGKRTLVKLPHTDGPEGRCTNPMAKNYLRYFDKGVLTSDSPDALEAIRANMKCSYWVSARKRILSQMPVYQSDVDMCLPGGDDQGMILPRTIPMGTVTRRAVEDTWLTASNANQSRIGSELKAMIRAPEGYNFVGADVDSEELWIASLLGDSVFGIHGGTALGWMTLEGTKSQGTDLHSRTAKILGISRNEAKVFNYGRIYGAGLNFAIRLLKQFNPEITDSEAESAATALYAATKGEKLHSKVFEAKNFWTGGSESVVFNILEIMARLPRQQTPVLGAGITAALASSHLSPSSNFLTSRINWTIQSSGVDYLHMLIASMHYLCSVYHIPARLAITVHDEIRYLVPEHDTLRTALALQISNLWTRSMFCQQLGLDDIPSSVAYFSLIDIDKVLRKEVDHQCITPSQPHSIEPGRAYDITELTSLCNSLGPADQSVVEEFASIPSTPRDRVMDSVHEEPDMLAFVRAQISTKNEAQNQERAMMVQNLGNRPRTRAYSHNKAVKGFIED